ncbi:MAG: aldo/keto reductase [Smithellaceae bacterium]|nr:aldo/keto reductase [Smithellaceae bacterium]
MEYVNLGKTGLKVSKLCLGCMTFGRSAWRKWVLDEEDSRSLIKKALEMGITFFDTADMYSLGGSEEVLGRALHDFARRDEIVVGTKVYQAMSEKPNDRGLSRKHIMHSIDNSLLRLKMDYVDLYQIHRFDSCTPVEETMEALNDVVRAGKALYLGASSMWAWQFSAMLHVAEKNGWSRFVSMQNHYNLIYREEEREMIPLCRTEGVGIIPWSPLARGFLAGNRHEAGEGETLRARTDQLAQEYYYQSADFAVLARVQEVAARYGKTPAQIALAWLTSRPGVTAPVIGASKLNQLDELASALEINLDERDVAALEELYEPHRVLGHG